MSPLYLNLVEKYSTTPIMYRRIFWVHKKKRTEDSISKVRFFLCTFKQHFMCWHRSITSEKSNFVDATGEWSCIKFRMLQLYA